MADRQVIIRVDIQGILLSGPCDRDRECEAVCDAEYG